MIQKLKFCMLYPFSFLWEIIYRLRRFLYNFGFFKRMELRVPVITVGSLVFGGAGKTPLTIWIANFICKRDKIPMVLTRGYKGRLEETFGLLRCGEKRDVAPSDYGDEPVLMRKRIGQGTIIVGKNRFANFLFHFEQEKPDALILDDGFQHLKISGQLNIVLFDLTQPLDKYKTAPLGYMREGFSALSDADIIAFNRYDGDKKEKIKYIKKKITPYLSTRVSFVEIDYRAISILSMNGDNPLTEKMKETQVPCICVSGIANPESFYTLVEDAGGKIVKKISFPDHHHYNLEEINDLLEMAKKERGIVLTTEKDIVKLKRMINSELIFYLPIEVKFLHGEDIFKEAIIKCLESH